MPCRRGVILSPTRRSRATRLLLSYVSVRLQPDRNHGPPEGGHYVRITWFLTRPRDPRECLKRRPLRAFSVSHRDLVGFEPGLGLEARVGVGAAVRDCVGLRVRRANRLGARVPAL